MLANVHAPSSALQGFLWCIALLFFVIAAVASYRTAPEAPGTWSGRVNWIAAGLAVMAFIFAWLAFAAP